MAKGTGTELMGEATELMSSGTDKTALEKRVQWLVLRGDARHGRQWYEDALEDYRLALSLSPSMPEVEKKIEAVIREGRNFNPYIGEVLKNQHSC